MFLNLFLNAADAMPKGGELRVALAPPRAARSRCAWPTPATASRPATWSASSSPFYTTKAAGEGSGLGLSVVQGIVAEHHGAIEVLRSDEAGTEFRLAVPGRAERGRLTQRWG